MPLRIAASLTPRVRKISRERTEGRHIAVLRIVSESELLESIENTIRAIQEARASMDERAAIVTGASGGIGASIAGALAAEGFVLTVQGRKKERLDELAAKLQNEFGVAVHTAAVDLLGDEVESIATSHIEATGRLDVLVNCAGGGIQAPLEKLKTRHVDHQLGLNLRSAILLFKACTPHLLSAASDRGRANVFNVSSTAGKRGTRALAAYSAAKFGLVGFNEACNREYGDRGIRSTLLWPALVNTPLAEAFDIPPEDMIQPDDLGEAVRFVLRVSTRCLIPEIGFTAPNFEF